MDAKSTVQTLAKALLASRKVITKSLEGVRISGHGQDVFIPFNSSSSINSTTGRGL